MRMIMTNLISTPTNTTNTETTTTDDDYNPYEAYDAGFNAAYSGAPKPEYDDPDDDWRWWAGFSDGMQREQDDADWLNEQT
jgi:hypothetical protein